MTYKSVGLRPNYLAKDKNLIDYIEANTNEQTDPDIKQIVKLSLSITSKQLNFTFNNNDKDPNKLITSKTAHCIGYASFFATTCNYLLKKNNLDNRWTAKTQKGHLNFFGEDIHPYFTAPFLKDHDFVLIENKKTGEILAVDPTANDYLYIDFITFIK